MDSKTALKNFWRLLDAGDRGRMAGLVALMLVASVFEILSLGTVPFFLAALAQGEALADGSSGSTFAAVGTSVREALGLESRRELLQVGAGALAAAFSAQMLYLLCLTYLKSRFIARIVRKMSNRLFTGYLRAPLSFHAARHSSEAASKIVMETMRLATQYAHPLLHLTQSFILILAIIVFVVAASPPSAMLVLGSVAVTAGLIMLVMRRKSKTYGLIYTQQNARLDEEVAEAIGCLKHIRLRGLEDRLENHFETAAANRADAIAFQRFTNEFPKPVLEGLAVIGMVVVVLTTLGSGTPASSVIPMLGLIGAAVARLLPHINQFTSKTLLVYQSVSVVATIARDVDAFNEAGVFEQHGTPATPVEGPLMRDRLLLEGVSYRYPGAETDSVHDVNIEIPKNSAVAFVGPTGAGKSTVVDLITGLIAPTAGHVRIDEADLATCRTAWQRHIGYIPQSIFLANASLRANVALGLDAEEIDDDRVNEVLREAQLDSFVASLPNGLDTHVGENGVRLSGGQRQRIGIARALYHDPEVLVFDEATAALDNETERRLMAAIDRVRANRTLIMIAHRLSSIRHCDRIFVMENARVTASGSYESLLDSSDAFRALAA